jgi:nucleotide-binding universal stress UspA family protein
MYTRVMVGYVNNQAGQAALQEAVRIAQVHHSALCLVHVTSSEDTEKQQEGLRLLENIKNSIEKSVSAETQLLVADPVYGLSGVAEVIAQASHDWKATLLVLGTNNRRGLKLFVVGSVVDNIINKVESSLLLVSSKFQLSVL